MSATIYLDNAATTSLDPSVLEEMLPYMTTNFGNPSSTYTIGRTARTAVETARKKVADLLNVTPTTLYFTSGGTESNNTVISCAINDLNCTHIITSAIEHHAVLYTVEKYCKKLNLSYSFVELLPNGEVDYHNLEAQLSQYQKDGKKCLVSLMHANNEIGTLLDLNYTGELCNTYNAIFHSDCVQTVGHYPIDLASIKVHFISAAGHKFHGPKGVGILYISKEIKVNPLIYGGGQERNMRAGTENIYGIVGFAKALENAMVNYSNDQHFISSLKAYFKKMLIDTIPGVTFNNPENSLYTILSVCFPQVTEKEMMLIHFDMAGICVSSGSACSSGDSGSHVIKELNTPKNSATIRFSFSKNNTFAEIDQTVAIVATVLPKVKSLSTVL
jgi:cysteine desulfurase